MSDPSPSLQDLRALRAAATEGPWEATDITDRMLGPGDLADYDEAEHDGRAQRMWWLSPPDVWLDQDEVCEGLFLTEANAELIVAAVNNLLPLLDRLEAAEKRVRELETEVRIVKAVLRSATEALHNATGGRGDE